MAWNQESEKYLRRGQLDGRPVQVLIDTGSSCTMVRADRVCPLKVNQTDTVPVMCVHGDSEDYPTTEVDLLLEGTKRKVRAVVAPNLPVPVVLGTGTDVYDVQEGWKDVELGLLVETRAAKKRRVAEEETAAGNVVQAVSKGIEPNGSGLVNDDKVIDGDEFVGEGSTHSKPTEGKQVVVDENIEVRDALDDCEGIAELFSEGSEVNWQGDMVENEVHGGKLELRREELEQDPSEAKKEQLVQWQQQDPTLAKIREFASQPPEVAERVFFYLEDGLIYRHWHPVGKPKEDIRASEQLVLPKQCRLLVLRLAHEVPMGGHLGVAKTRARILQRYYWPGIFQEVNEYCRTCEICQRSRGKRPARSPLIPMPLIQKPFMRIAMDLVGPLPKSRRGNKYILTICDYATRYPEAIPLLSIEATRIARELIILFSRFGVPEEILTDQGSNFLSSLLGELYHALQINRIRTTPYHPQTDGLVERFNGTLKSMLGKFVSRNQKDWDDYLPYLLFSYREVPQESTGFSPFELLYGHHVRGPLDVLKEGWTREYESEVPVATHVVQMRDRLHEMVEVVQENMEQAQKRQKQYYDRGTRGRDLEEGDQVLVLLPTRTNKLKLEWVGPYRVTRKVTKVDYEVETPGRRREKKVYHINLLKKWNSAPEKAMLAVMESRGAVGPEAGGLYLWGSEIQITMDEIETPGLGSEERQQLLEVMEEFPVIFSSTPGRTSLTHHQIHVEDTVPVRQKPYRVPYSKRVMVKQELEKMLEAKVIQPSTSPWASPLRRTGL